MTEIDMNPLESAIDYQDLSALQYKRARRLRDQGAQAWVVQSAQDYAAELSAKARSLREQGANINRRWIDT
jgi:hypothetical protein